MKPSGWTWAYGVLLAGWVAGAALSMAGVAGAFLTNYLADLAFPAWFYIHIRGLRAPGGKKPRLLWVGRSPERALVSIFLVGALSELKTRYWPSGIIRGTFAPWDIAAYAAGLLLCYAFDKAGERE